MPRPGPVCDDLCWAHRPRCASPAFAPLPLIFSYKSEKSLCGAGAAFNREVRALHFPLSHSFSHTNLKSPCAEQMWESKGTVLSTEMRAFSNARWYRGTGAGYPGHPEAKPDRIGTSAFGPNLNGASSSLSLSLSLCLSVSSYDFLFAAHSCLPLCCSFP